MNSFAGEAFQWIVTYRLALAFIAGIVIGFDRERSGKAAGMRTQMLVCVGSALLAGISVFLGKETGHDGADPARLMAQIVSGVGFLGAGVILKTGDKLVGVTTAATIWMTAAIGISIGAGFYIPAFFGVLMVLTMNPIAHVQYKMGLKGNYYALCVEMEDVPETEKILKSLSIRVSHKDMEKDMARINIFSSFQRNEGLINMLYENGIHYEIEQLNGAGGE